MFLNFASMRNIPFSPPRVDQTTINAVVEVLQSGWITTGPKTRLLESKISDYCKAEATLCLNSWTNAVELILRWFGVGPGDEVIVPAYTYSATGNIVFHVGATPVLVDCDKDSFLVSAAAIKEKITSKTKVIMPVDIGGMPVDYEQFMDLVRLPEVKQLFQPKGENQKNLGRILVISDAAHSFGANYKGKRVGTQCDVAGFSFHAVKNLTTAEGGALIFNLPEPFVNAEIRASINISALHGQTKDALSKTQAGQWRYDIIEAGYKCNMTDIHAAIGLVELERYQETLDKRESICEIYNSVFSKHNLFVLPEFHNEFADSCFHLYMLRVKNASEEQRDSIIKRLAERGISTNVHFQPLPLLTYYKNQGFRINDFPNAWSQYESEISLPVYFDLSEADALWIAENVIECTQQVFSK